MQKLASADAFRNAPDDMSVHYQSVVMHIWVGLISSSTIDMRMCCGCRAYNKEREAAAERRRAAEADAYARSRKILEEELARDRAWRDAVKQVSIA